MQSELDFAPYAQKIRNWVWTANLLVAASYVVSGWIGLYATGRGTAVADLWPPAAVALVAVVLAGPRLVPGVAAGAAVLAILSTHSLGVAGGVALGTALEAWLGYELLRRVPGFSVNLSNARSVIALLSASALTPWTSALIGSASLLQAGLINPASFSGVATRWWLGDALAILFISPVILSFRANPFAGLNTLRSRAPLWMVLVLAIVSFGVLDGRLDWVMGSTSALYLLLPFVILLALGDNIALCALGNLVVLACAFWGIAHHNGPFADKSPVEMQLFLAGMAVATLLLAALTREKAQALRLAQRNLDRFRSLTSLTADWYWETDSQHRVTFLSEEFENKSGLRIADFIGKTRYESPINAFESDKHRAEHLATLNAHGAFRELKLRRTLRDGSLRWASISGEPVFGPQGEFEGYRGIGRDITASTQNTLRIEESQRFLDTLINAISSPVLVKDDSHRFIAANLAFAEFSARPLNEILGKTDFDFFSDEHARRYQAKDREALERGEVSYEDVYPVKGKLYWMHVRKSSTTLPDGRRIIVLVMMDITDRKTAEGQLRDSEQRFRDFAQAAGDYAFELDLAGNITFCSSRGAPLLGYAVDEILGRTWFDFMPEDEAARVRDWIKEHMRPDGSYRDLEQRVTTKQGEERWLLVNTVGIFDAQGRRVGQRGSARDITDRKSVEDRINYLATRDALTGLPNRVLFGDRITQAIAAARRSGQMVALFFMDLDRFKHINDSLGHDVGDALLKQVAERMLACVRKRDTLARLGGDEFVLALEGVQQAEDVAQVAGKIIRAIAQPFEIAEQTLSTSCSVGISIFPNDADDDRTLMKNADTAMYHAKERGRNNFQFFSSDMNTRAVERGAMETALRKAVADQNFLLHFQPIVDLRTGRIVTLEGLLRWNHPERGLVTPSHFIDVAEDCGLIGQIGHWVLREACSRAKEWDMAGYPAYKVAVNVSARQLLKPAEFVRAVTRIISDTGLDPKRLELEVTESILLHNAEEISHALRKLTREGLSVSVDDFGTGYTSLSYLRQFPIESVKIDRSFVRDVDSNSEHASVIQAIVAMGHSLGLTITAEGVETRAQLTALSKLGCDTYQGNLFSKPLPPIDLAARFLAPGELDLQVAQP